uniref:Arf-GAP domain-containing protein n=1 Tax=Schistocephalus solidus TaxID=70667 RepID=A0A0X3PBX0_SCHSO
MPSAFKFTYLSGAPNENKVVCGLYGPFPLPTAKWMDSGSVLCADCNARNPQWASVNRGVFLCDECNSIHRQLGRHVSQTKHLHKSLWRPTQHFMVQYLALAGANGFWEHLLLEPCLTRKAEETQKKNPKVRKKPTPDSPLHTEKSEFIREKYLFNGFFKRPQVVHPDDLNMQLHASVRTAVLETSLYLLALGANPNFIHPTKGTSPVHVACQYEQVGQLELLIAYGGDVCLRTTAGVSALEIALERAYKAQEEKSNDGGEPTDVSTSPLPWSPIIDCIVLTFYELTDGLSFYLCRRLPNHKAVFLMNSTTAAESNEVNSCAPEHRASFYGPGHFLIVPAPTTQNCQPSSRRAPGAEPQVRVKNLDNVAFEDLCIDVYDEAERRLTNAILEPNFEENGERTECLQNGSVHGDGQRPRSAMASAKHSLALFFLPPNTAYSTVRNQARQKLGRLSVTEFRTLVVDVLTEAANRLTPLLENATVRRRDAGASRLPLIGATRSAVSRHPSQPHHNYSTYEQTPHPPSPPSQTVDTCIVDPLQTPSASKPGYPLQISPPIESIPPPPPPLPSPSPQSAKATLRTCLFEDPVYDQVASEADTCNATASSRSPCRTPLSAPSVGGADADFPSLPSDDMPSPPSPPPPPLPPTAVDNASTAEPQSQPLYVPSESDTGGCAPPPSQSILSAAPSIATSPTGIESKPGHLPGSRRLHLTATGRTAAVHRASVPSGQRPLPTFSLDALRPAKPPVQQSAVAPPPSRPNTRSVELQVTAPCCLDAHQEIQELKEANYKLLEEKEKLSTSRTQWNADRMALEQRIERLELLIGQLREENSALKAAFSAGMVMSHKRPSEGNDLDHSSNEASPRCTSNGVVKQTQSPVACAKNLTNVHKVEEEEEEEEYCYNDDVSGLAAKVSAQSNYAVGTQCLDSGILLRQGISLWGAATPPGQSEASRNPISTPAAVAAARKSSSPHSRLNQSPTSASASPLAATVSITSPGPVGGIVQPATSTCIQRAYVNISPSSVATEEIRAMSSRSSARREVSHSPRTRFNETSSSVIGNRSVTTAPVVHHDTDLLDDYTAPNETGSPSPAPVLLGPTHRAHQTASAGVARSAAIPMAQHASPSSSFACPGVGSRPPVRISDTEEYVTASGPQPTFKGSPTMAQDSAAGLRSPSQWNQPPYERIVRGVECIIVRIRGLLDATNARRPGELVRSSQLIQLAVQDLVMLFPPISKCQLTVATALTTLMSNSQKLRLHCERLGSGKPQQEETCKSEANPLITFAHEIASAAKTILTFYQSERQ